MSRKIGVEIEFYGVDVAQTSTLLSGLFNGDIKQNSNSEATLENSQIGDIKVELDAQLAHKISDYTSKNNNDFSQTLGQAGNELLRLASVPVEIVFPPVDINKLDQLDSVIPLLCDAGAKGTQDSPFFAFGVHLNVSTSETKPAYYRDVMLSFFLLQYWLAKKTRQDFSRVVSGYNKLYPHKFGIGLMNVEFLTLIELINFYEIHVPDRNYALDMYPLWAHLHKDCLSEKKQNLIKARPTFHYRLPDCKLGQEGWNFSQEYKWWCEVEKLAKDKKKLNDIVASYCKSIPSFSDPFGNKWLEVLINEWGYDEK